MIRGRHTFVWGGQLEEGYDNYLQTNTGGGLDLLHRIVDIAAPGIVGAGNVQGRASNGEDFADFLLGYGNGQGSAFGNQTTGSLVISGPVSGKQTYRAFYFGDNWHVTSKLTLNLGLRYELQGPWSERFDKMTYFDPKATNSSVTGCSGVGGKRHAPATVPGEDWRERQPQQPAAFEDTIHAATWICLLLGPEDCDSRRIRNLLHSELRLVRNQPLRRSGQQRHFKLLRQQRPAA